jgi:riboflavin biosynthesis pyrimidine reductase
VRLAAAGGGPALPARAIVKALHRTQPCRLILVEGGPHLMSDFFAAHCLDELFLTLAPQVAGRDGRIERPGLVAGHRFAPDHPIWGNLIDVRRGASHLFLHYAFASTAERADTTTSAEKET